MSRIFHFVLAFLLIVPPPVIADDPIIDIGQAPGHRLFRDAIAGESNPPLPDPDDPDDPDVVKDFGDELRYLFDEQWKRSKGPAPDDRLELKLPYEPGTVLTFWPKTNDDGSYKGGRHLNIERLENVVVDLNGCVLHAQLPQTILLLEELRNVTLQNFTLMGSGDLATLATWDAAGRQFVVEDGYPTGYQLFTACGIPDDYDGGPITDDTIYREDFIQDLSEHRGSPSRYGTYRREGRAWVHQRGPLPDFADGAKVMLQLQNNYGHALRPDNEEYIENVTIQNVKFVNIPGMAISGEHDGHFTVRNCTFERLPGALLSVASDGVHLDNSKPGLLIEDCDFSYINDDFINTNAKASAITLIDGNTVTVSAIPEASGAINIAKWCDAGERHVFTTRTNEGKPADGGPVIVTESTSRSTEDDKAHTFTVASTDGLEVGMICVNADRASGDAEIRNNRLHQTRAAGIKARGPNIEIHHNEITRCMSAAVRFESFTKRGEGYDVRNGRVWANTVDGSGVRDDVTTVGGMPEPYYIDTESAYPVEDVKIWEGER